MLLDCGAAKNRTTTIIVVLCRSGSCQYNASSLLLVNLSQQSLFDPVLLMCCSCVAPV